jgi:hypothetical protein
MQEGKISAQRKGKHKILALSRTRVDNFSHFHEAFSRGPEVDDLAHYQPIKSASGRDFVVSVRWSFYYLFLFFLSHLCSRHVFFMLYIGT